VEATSPADGTPGPVEVALRDFLEVSQWPPDDPRTVGKVVAAQLARALDARPGPTSLARELRTVLQWLSDRPNNPPTIIDELRAKVYADKVDRLLGAMAP
jgi:hypothetical protein